VPHHRGSSFSSLFAFSFFFLDRARARLAALLTLSQQWRTKTRMARRSQRLVLLSSPPRTPHAHTRQFSGKWISISHTVMAYCEFLVYRYSLENANQLQAHSSELWLLACMQPLFHSATTRLNAPQIATLPQNRRE
jgi:hypothetical protein